MRQYLGENNAITGREVLGPDKLKRAICIFYRGGSLSCETGSHSDPSLIAKASSRYATRRRWCSYWINAAQVLTRLCRRSAWSADIKHVASRCVIIASKAPHSIECLEVHACSVKHRIIDMDADDFAKHDRVRNRCQA